MKQCSLNDQVQELAEWFDSQDVEIRELEDQIQLFKKSVATHNAEYKMSRDQADSAREASAFFRELCQRIQMHIHSRIAGVATSCLGSVFEDPFEVKIEFESKRGSTEAHIILKNGELEISPRDSCGFGVLDVLGFSLRLGAICATRGTPKIIILDEAFRFVSAGYRETLASLLESLSKELGFQFIQVTHIEELKIGKVVEI